MSRKNGEKDLLRAKSDFLAKNLTESMLEKMLPAIIYCSWNQMRLLLADCFTGKYLSGEEACGGCKEIEKFYDIAIDIIHSNSSLKFEAPGSEIESSESEKMKIQKFVRSICAKCKDFGDCKPAGCYEAYTTDYQSFIGRVMFPSISKMCTNCRKKPGCRMKNYDIEKCFLQTPRDEIKKYRKANIINFEERARNVRERVVFEGEDEYIDIEEENFPLDDFDNEIKVYRFIEGKKYRLIETGGHKMRVLLKDQSDKYIYKPKKKSLYYLEGSPADYR